MNLLASEAKKLAQDSVIDIKEDLIKLDKEIAKVAQKGYYYLQAQLEQEKISDFIANLESRGFVCKRVFSSEPRLKDFGLELITITWA